MKDDLRARGTARLGHQDPASEQSQIRQEIAHTGLLLAGGKLLFDSAAAFSERAEQRCQASAQLLARSQEILVRAERLLQRSRATKLRR